MTTRLRVLVRFSCAASQRFGFLVTATQLFRSRCSCAWSAKFALEEAIRLSSKKWTTSLHLRELKQPLEYHLGQFRSFATSRAFAGQLISEAGERLSLSVVLKCQACWFHDQCCWRNGQRLRGLDWVCDWKSQKKSGVTLEREVRIYRWKQVEAVFEKLLLCYGRWKPIVSAEAGSSISYTSVAAWQSLIC